MIEKVFLLIFSLSFCFFPGNYAQTMNVMTYNIRVDIPFDTANSWEKRQDALVQLLNTYKPDVFGVQEALQHQLLAIKKGLQYYDYVGVGRTDGATKGEYSAIFYNRERFEVLCDSTFWLSETPEKPSRGWDAAYDRVCTYVLLKDKESGKLCWVFNTHLDNEGIEARMNGAGLILTRIEEVVDKTDCPVMLMGDMNCEEDDEPIVRISNVLNDSRAISKKKPQGPNGTFNGFGSESELKRRIDYLFVDDRIAVYEYQAISDKEDSRWPSDHLPVMIRLVIK